LYKAIEKGIPADKVAIIIDIIKKAFFELGDAEALELRFRGRMDVTPEEYLDVVKKKAADVEAYTHISAILGGGSKDETEFLREYGRLLGMIIILRDDLADMIDSKEFVHRIKKECLPLPILYALQFPKIKSTLSPILLKKAIKKVDAEKILEITDRTGGLERVEKLTQKLAKSAYQSIRNIQQNKQYLTLLVEATI